MADQNVRINIGTSYEGTGLNKAMGAMDKLSKAAGKGASAIGKIGGAFDSLGGQAGKAIGSVTSALGAIASGGLVAGAVAAVTSLVQLFIDMRTQAENLKKAQEKAFSDNLNKQIETYGKNIDAVIGKLDKLNSQQLKVAQSTAALNAALSDKSIAQRELDAAKEGAGSSGGELSVIQARANVDIAKLKGQKSVDAAKSTAGTRAGDLRTTEESLKLVGKELAGLKELVPRLDEMNRTQHAVAAKSGFTNERQTTRAHQYQEAYNKAVKRQKELLEKQADLEKKREAQKKELDAANEAVKTAEMQATAQNMKAEKALRDAEDKAFDEEEKARIESTKATWGEVAVRVDRNNAMLDEEKAEKKVREAIKREPKLREELARATKELKDAELELADKLRAVRIADMGWRGGAPAGGGALIGEGQIIGNGINGKNRYDPRNNQSKNDAGYNARMEEGFERNARSQGYGLSAKEQKEFDRLANKFADEAAGKTSMSDKERERFKELAEKDPETQKAKAEREAEKAAQKKKNAEKQKEIAEQKLQLDVSAIRTWLDNHDGAK